MLHFQWKNFLSSSYFIFPFHLLWNQFYYFLNTHFFTWFVKYLFEGYRRIKIFSDILPILFSIDLVYFLLELNFNTFLYIIMTYLSGFIKLKVEELIKKLDKNFLNLKNTYDMPSLRSIFVPTQNFPKILKIISKRI